MGKLWWTAGAVAAITVGAVLSRPVEVRLSDLSVYLGAAAGLDHGASLYDYIRGDAPFTYPPFAGLLFRPLSWLPLSLVQLAWSLATVGFVAGLAVLVSRSFARPLSGALALVLILSAPV